MSSRIRNRTMKKFQNFNKDKKVPQYLSDIQIFKTHSVFQSDAEILFPQQFDVNKFRNSIAMVTYEGQVIWTEITENSFQCGDAPDKKKDAKDSSSEAQSKEIISILETLIVRKGVEIDRFKAKLNIVSKDQIPKNYYLAYAELYVKDVYLSRRDQYKILNYLKDKNIHVYNRKLLHFDKLMLEVGNLLHHQNLIAQSGMINKDTKIIFRSACSKYTILVQISTEMFELNHENQLFIEKSIQFLTLFLLRNQFFQTKHSLEIILYARLFYPEFDTLEEAYKALKTYEGSVYSQQQEKKQFIEKNFSVSLQKDHQDRIYQDAYRRIAWYDDQVHNFRGNFWQKVSEFLFTINWNNNQSYVKTFNKLTEQSIKEASESLPKEEFQSKRPFQHHLKCQLSSSQESCLFEAISVVSQQYKHHYYFRSLSETGNAITIISAGKSHYIVDETTYKMTKSNIYLTNISCILLNLRWQKSVVTTDIICMKNKPLYNQKKGDIKKLKGLIDWCKQQDAYKSPMNFQVEFPPCFELKSLIYPQNLEQLRKDETFQILPHLCSKQKHYNNNEKIPVKNEYCIKQKEIRFISTFFMSDQYYTAHEYFYDYEKFQQCFSPSPLYRKKNIANPSKNLQKTSKLIQTAQTFKGISQKKLQMNLSDHQQHKLEQFEQDLQRIINKKKNYDFANLGANSKISKITSEFIDNAKNLRTNLIENYFGNKLYNIEQESQADDCFEEEAQSEGCFTKKQYIDHFTLGEREKRSYSQHGIKVGNIPILDASTNFYQRNQKFRKQCNDKCHSVYQTKFLHSNFFATTVPNFDEQKINQYTVNYSQKKIIRKSFNNLQQSSQAGLGYQQYLNLPAKMYRRKATEIIHEKSENNKPVHRQAIIEKTNFESQKKKLNIFDETYQRTVYIPNKIKEKVDFHVPKELSHNKLRFKMNEINSNIHYMNLNFNQTSKKKLEKFIKIRQNNWCLQSEPNTLDSHEIEYFQLQKNWKNIIFPILTPIYTEFRTNQEHQSYTVKQSQTGEYAIEEEICKYLMDNYQIESQSNALIMNLSKGHVHTRLSFPSEENVATYESVGKKKQMKIVPCMFYRYLSYENMDARFGSKYIVFSDSNFYNEEVVKPKKSVKLALIPFSEGKNNSKTMKPEGQQETTISEDQMLIQMNLQAIKNFIKNLKDRYEGINVDEQSIQIGIFQSNSPTYSVSIDLVKGLKNNQIYKKQVIDITIDLSFHPLNIFTFIIQWDYCCAIYVNSFIKNVKNIAHRNDLITHLLSRSHAFDTKWTISTIGELVFDSRSATGLIELDLVKNRQWIWDNLGYYMSRNGQAFIRFIDNKNLVEWRENNMNQSKEQKSRYDKFFDKFFLIAAAYDIVGSLIDTTIPDETRNQRIYSLTLST